MTSGMLPMKEGKLLYTKEIGGVFHTADDGYKAAKICVLNALAQ